MEPVAHWLACEQRAWAALDRGQGPAVSGKATPVAAAASSVVAKDGGAADDGQTSGDTPLSVLLQQREWWLCAVV